MVGVGNAKEQVVKVLLSGGLVALMLFVAAAAAVVVVAAPLAARSIPIRDLVSGFYFSCIDPLRPSLLNGSTARLYYHLLLIQRFFVSRIVRKMSFKHPVNDIFSQSSAFVSDYMACSHQSKCLLTLFPNTESSDGSYHWSGYILRAPRACVCHVRISG